jgi:glycosyltransferase involved in cell wall biosynthesis
LTTLEVVRPEDLHVLRIYERLPPEPGGMERHIAELTAAQRKLGVKVTSIYNTGSADGDSIQILQPYELYRLRPALVRNLIFYGAIARHQEFFRRTNVNVVHAHGGWSAFMLATALAKATGASVVAASVHGFIKPNPAWHRRAMKGCNPIFATGLSEVGYFNGILPGTAHHLPSAPADLFFATPAEGAEPTDVIVAGNLVPVKRTELILECAKSRPQTRFSIYGDGPERARLEALKTEAGLGNVTFHGMTSLDRIHSAMCYAKLFLNVSQTEGSPTAALEAMACGLPVVLTPSNDYSALVRSEENGIVTRGWDIEEITSAIDRCLADEDRRRTMAERGKQIAEGHRWEAKARFVTEAMMNVLENRSVSSPNASIDSGPE